MTTFAGIWAALWTPTDAKGNLIKDAIKQHLQFLKTSGIQGIVIGGSTGEFPRLSLRTRQDLHRYVLKEADPLPVLVNISHPNYDEIQRLAQDVRDNGAVGALVLPPSYYAVSQQDIIAYYEELLTYTQDFPLILYNFPACVRNSLEIETIDHLATHPSIVGIKHSGTDFDMHRPLVAISQKRNFSVFIGSEKHLQKALQLGVNGIIGGMTSVIPELTLDIYHQKASDRRQSKIDAIYNILSPLTFPYNVAALMQARGFETRVV